MEQHISSDEDENTAKDATIEHAIESLEAGRGVSHGIVREWLLNLAKGIRRPVSHPGCDDASETQNRVGRISLQA